MELLDKVKVLADAAKYDVSCSSSGSKRKSKKGKLGNAHYSGICHSWADDGRCISLLKILFTNDCIYDCAYCVNRATNNIKRATFTPQEIVDITINFYRRNYIEGLFLSSAVHKNPNYTMELLLTVVKKLRIEEEFNGYIHLKAIPGADPKLIEEAGEYADRMSVNIELPSDKGLRLLAPQKNKKSIIKPMGLISSRIKQKKEERKKFRRVKKFVPAGQSTQLIVGATPDSDLNILKLSETLYKSFKLRRVYYSAYVPIMSHPNLPSISSPPLIREHRLYQADWLLRFYKFNASELLDYSNPNFDIDLDPKCDWALRNLEMFPVEINKTDYDTLLRVPGIGVKSARKILAARRFGPLTYADLKKMRIVLKRAKYFITIRGKYFGKKVFNRTAIRDALLFDKINNDSYREHQISLFSLHPNLLPTDERMSVVTGQI